MKKILLLLSICTMLIGFPIATAIQTPIATNLQSRQKTNQLAFQTKFIDDQPRTTDDPPSWANGNFSGVWGLDIWGEVQIPIGWMFGYYKFATNLGYFYAGFADFGQENVSWFIQGYFFGPFMFGSLGENESANETIFVGIGRYNETNYTWRVMGETGPTFFMKGVYTKFN